MALPLARHGGPHHRHRFVGILFVRDLALLLVVWFRCFLSLILARCCCRAWRRGSNQRIHYLTLLYLAVLLHPLTIELRNSVSQTLW